MRYGIVEPVGPSGRTLLDVIVSEFQQAQSTPFPPPMPRLLPLSTLLLIAPALAAQQYTMPLRQSKLDSTAADPRFEVPLDSTSDGRWLGGGATLPRWDVQGQWAYFQYALDPKPILAGQADDPWWRV